ncbi:MAG: terminase large subunit [Ruminococcaceae bacterium]|nr:terminase large subunit [Oscillospiraceae bacterium]
MTPFANYIQEYHHRIQTGEIVAGKWIKLLYEKITAGLRDGLFFFDDRKANRAITFIETFCHHCEGRSDLIKLELWQKAAVSLIFGIVDAGGLRIYREVFMVIARKNGKSLFASAVIAYMAYLDGEHGAKIYCLAPKLEQAEIVYENFYQIIKQEPELDDLADRRRSDIYLESTNTSIKKLAFNAKKSDGFNPHLTVCDEIASWPAEQGRKQYEVMKSALGARKQPLILSISTAGYVNDGPYDELMIRSTAVLLGSSQERRLLPLLYIIDDISKWDDIEELKKSNPNMGVSVSEDFFLEEIAIARNSLSKRAEFLTKYCNIKQNSTQAWLPYDVVDAVTGEAFRLESFKSTYCVGGIDLSQTTDLTACCVVIEKEGRLYVLTKFFMPANKVDYLAEREGVPYRIYVQQGLIQLSGENYVDYHDCFEWFRMLVEEYEILPLKIGYDRYSSQYLIQDLDRYGFHTDDVYQGENLTPVLKECDGLLRDGVLRLGDNNLLKAHFLNVGVKQNNETRKIRPVKIDERCHIDGFVAVIDALTVRQKWYDQIGDQLKNAS